MKEGWGDGTPTGEAKSALSYGRELNFEKITKKHDFLKQKQKLRSRVGGSAEFGEKRNFATHLERPKWSSRVGESSIFKI